MNEDYIECVIQSASFAMAQLTEQRLSGCAISVLAFYQHFEHDTTSSMISIVPLRA